MNNLFFPHTSSMYYSEVELKTRSAVLLQSTRDFVSTTRSGSALLVFMNRATKLTKDVIIFLNDHSPPYLGQDTHQVRLHLQSSRYLTLVDAHSTLERMMPNVNDPRGLLPSETYAWCNPGLVQAHLAWHVSTILLYSVQSKAEGGGSTTTTTTTASSSAKRRMVRSAERIAAITKQLRVDDGGLMPVHAHLNSIVRFFFPIFQLSNS